MKNVAVSAFVPLFGVALAVPSCTLPLDVKNACVTQGDCLDGYTCVAQVCVPRPGQGSATTGMTPGGITPGGISTGGTTGAPIKTGPVTAQDLVACADPNTLPTLPTSDGPATHLVFLLQPADGTTTQQLCPVVVAVVDANGAVVPSAADAITLASSATTLEGGTQVSPNQGIATFSTLQIDEALTDVSLHATQNIGAPDALSGDSTTFTVHAPAWTLVSTWDWPLYLAADANNGTTYAFGYLGSFASTDNGNSWATMANVIGYSLVVQQHFPYAQFKSNSGLAVSTDGGITWQSACGHLDSTTCSNVTPVAADPITNTVAVMSNEGVYVTQDLGVTWTRIITQRANQGVTNVTLANNVLYAAVQYSHTLIVSNGLSLALSYLTVNPASPNAVITHVAVDPQDANTVYVTATDGLFISHDRGASYTQPIHGCASNVAVVNNGNTSHLYAALNDCQSGDFFPTPGVATSADGGATWQNIGWGIAPMQPDAFRGAGPVDCGVLLVPGAQNDGTIFLSLGWCGGVYRARY